MSDNYTENDNESEDEALARGIAASDLQDVQRGCVSCHVALLFFWNL